MAIRRILSDKKPMLRKISMPVTSFDKSLHKLLDDMLQTMRKADGVGLAAVQVGVLLRAVIIEIDEDVLELINPRIMAAEGEQLGVEGCLSVSGDNCYVMRPKFVEVEFQDRNGNHRMARLQDLGARCCCHEVDHLEGIIFYDREYEGEIPKEEDDE